jgi:hypothetical protein
MKPSFPKTSINGFTSDTVTCLFSNSGFTTDTERFRDGYLQFHHRNRVLNLAGGGRVDWGRRACHMKLLSTATLNLPLHSNTNDHTLGWTTRELFGLHPVPEHPAANYKRLSRYDATGLIWLLRGKPVCALTATEAAIRRHSGATVMWRKFKELALGQLGDSRGHWI